MKRLILFFCLLLFTPVYGETLEGEVINTKVVIYDQVIDTTKYPIFTYDDKVYIPLSSHNVHGLGLKLSFDDQLMITTTDREYSEINDLNEHYHTDKKIHVTEVPFEVMVNGKNINHYYTVLMYRSTLYVPMIDSLVSGKLGWTYDFDEILYINSQNKKLLNVDRVKFTPGEDITSVGLTFSLDRKIDDLSCIINNTSYSCEVTRVEVTEKGAYNYSYKTTLYELNPEQVYEIEISNEDYISRTSFSSLCDGNTRIAFFGDIQGYKQSQYDQFHDNHELASEFDIDLTYVAGDIVDTGDSWLQWRFFDEAINNNLVVTSIGNHDVIGSSDIYVKSFNYPNNGLINERNFYFDLPYARVAVWDTESFSTYKDQGEWLCKVMETEKFKIVLMHRSVYPMSYDESFIRNLHQYFDQAEIDLVLSGHDHIYNRTTMKHNTLDENGTTYIVGGSGSGSKFYSKNGDRYWEQVLYDEKKSVFVIVDIGETSIDIIAYNTENLTEPIDVISIKESE
jgi:predicted phosphodiesterase